MIDSKKLIIKTPLPKYAAGPELHKILLEHIQSGEYSVGDPFLTDREVIEVTQRSRSVVRSVFKRLQEEGWIERKGGVGTFVGPRLAASGATYPLSAKPSPKNSESNAEKIFKFAVAGLGNTIWSRRNWCSDLFDGMAECTDNEMASIEYLGSVETDRRHLEQRFLKNRPDLILCLGPGIDHFVTITEAKRQNIPCILVGVRNPEFNVPCVYDDGVHAAKLAVQHLARLGHTKIAFVQAMSTNGWWAFDRYQGYIEGLKENGISIDKEMSLWLPLDLTQNGLVLFEELIESRRPSAVIFGCSWISCYLQRIFHQNADFIPGNLSVVFFDQDKKRDAWFVGIQPTYISVPLRQIGKRAVELGKKMIRFEGVEMETIFQSTLIEGNSTKKI